MDVPPAFLAWWNAIRRNLVAFENSQDAPSSTDWKWGRQAGDS